MAQNRVENGTVRPNMIIIFKMSIKMARKAVLALNYLTQPNYQALSIESAITKEELVM